MKILFCLFGSATKSDLGRLRRVVRTVTVWSTLQSSEHQNDQTQEQCLSPSNPSHEHLMLHMEHTTLLYNYLFTTHTFFCSFQICTCQTSHTIICIVYCVFAILYIIFLYICILLFSCLCRVLSVILLHCGASVTITNSSYV